MKGILENGQEWPKGERKGGHLGNHWKGQGRILLPQLQQWQWLCTEGKESEVTTSIIGGKTDGGQ